MFVFLKAQSASIIATFVDFLTTLLLVGYLGHRWYLLGTAVGTIVGGITHFLISRHFVFQAAGSKISSQALKYLMVWIVYLLLTTGLVYIITEFGKIGYIYSKMIVAVTMSVSYNFLLHKKFVFR